MKYRTYTDVYYYIDYIIRAYELELTDTRKSAKFMAQIDSYFIQYEDLIAYFEFGSIFNDNRRRHYHVGSINKPPQAQTHYYSITRTPTLIQITGPTKSIPKPKQIAQSRLDNVGNNHNTVQSKLITVIDPTTIAPKIFDWSKINSY